MSSSGGSFSNLLGFNRVNSSSRLSRSELGATAGGGSSSNLIAAAGADGSSAVPVVVVDGSGDNNNSCSSSSAGSEWLVSTLGQQWRDEKPFPEVGRWLLCLLDSSCKHQ